MEAEIIIKLTLFILYISGVSMIEINSFEECVSSDPWHKAKYCFGQEAQSLIMRLAHSDNYEVMEGLMLQKNDELSPRVINSDFEETESSSFKGILEKIGVIVGERIFLVDLYKLEPGLYMKVNPSLQKGVLEFVMDPNKKRDHRTLYKAEKSVGRVLTKQFIVPFLLGIKFHLATLVPLMFGLMILISKKAIFLLKIIVFVANLFSLGGIGGYGGFGGAQQFFPQQYGSGHYPYKQHEALNYNEPLHDMHENLYKVNSNFDKFNSDSHNDDRFYEFDKETFSPTESNRHRFSSNAFKNIAWKSE